MEQRCKFSDLNLNLLGNVHPLPHCGTFDRILQSSGLWLDFVLCLLFVRPLSKHPTKGGFGLQLNRAS